MTIHLNRRNSKGMAVLIVIVLLAVMVTLILAATHSLTQLKAELKQVERAQTNRLTHTTASPAKE